MSASSAAASSAISTSRRSNASSSSTVTAASTAQKSSKATTVKSSKASSSKGAANSNKPDSRERVKHSKSIQEALANPSPGPLRTESQLEKEIKDLETQIASMPASNKTKTTTTTGKSLGAAAAAGEVSMEKSVGFAGEQKSTKSNKNTSSSAPPPPEHHTHVMPVDFPGGMTKDKFDTLKASLGTSHGAHMSTWNKDGHKSAELDAWEYNSEDDYESTVSSNPSVWEGNLCRKNKDMLWQFSCDPLRVINPKSKHWSRLHSTNKQIIPQPGGGLKMIEVRIPYTKDAEIEEAVKSSGVAKAKKERVLPPLPLPPPVNTPRMRELLKQQTVKPLPKKKTIDLNQVVRDGGKFPKEEVNDGDSVFSQSSLGSSAVGGGGRAASSVASSASGKGRQSRKVREQELAACEGGSVVSQGSIALSLASSKRSSAASSKASSCASSSSAKRSQHSSAASAVSSMTASSQAASSAYTGTTSASSRATASTSSSHRSRASTKLDELEAKLRRERAEVMGAVDEVHRAQKELEALEAMLNVSKAKN